MAFENIHTCSATTEHNNNDWLKTIKEKTSQGETQIWPNLKLILQKEIPGIQISFSTNFGGKPSFIPPFPFS
jgi:hypothetical protein